MVRSPKKVSLADLIVLGGCAAVEAAAKKAGHDVKVPFSPGRTDASQEQTDVNSFAVLEPAADGFRNYLRKGHHGPAAELLLDRANLLTLTAPEMTVLIGGLRALNANFGHSEYGVFTKQPECIDQRLLRQSPRHEHEVAEVRYLGRRVGGERSGDRRAQVERHRSRSRLRFQLPTPGNVAEVYACDDSKETFVKDFVAAWNKVMNLDRYDLG
jgi:catalase-peroxidase